MIALLDGRDVASNRLDDAGRFVAEDRRCFGRQRPMQAVQIAMAYSACDRADQHLMRTGPIDLHFFD
jgi:hypothetical protein